MASSGRCSRSWAATSRRRLASTRRSSGAPRLGSPSCSDRSAPQLQIRRKEFVFRYRSAEDWVDTFREFYGPTLKAFGALDAAAQSGLEQDLLMLAREHNTSDRGLRVPSEYAEVVATV